MAYGYGTNSPFGLKPSRNWDGTTNPYYIASGYATSLFKGDPVWPLAGGTIGLTTGTVGTTGIQGVFWGCKYTDSSNVLHHSDYWPGGTTLSTATATTGAIAYIIDDPNVLFDIQVSSTTDNPGNAALAIAETNLNQNASFALDATNAYNGNPGEGSTVTGLSGYFLDFSSLGNGGTLNLKLIQLTPFINNVFYNNVSNIPYNNVIVQINNHVLKGGTGTAGI